jgi:hypothetical protein
MPCKSLRMLMPKRKFLHPVAWTLLVAVLLMLGVTTGSAVAHEIEHAHHTAAMHGTGICAWMCASATTAATSAVLPSAVVPVEDLPVPQDFRSSSALFLNRLQARAPPFSL